MELQVGAFTYDVGRIDAMTQYDIVRQLAPLAAAVLPVVEAKGAPSEAVRGMLQAFAGMPRAESRQVLFDLLGCVRRKLPGGTGYAPVVAGGTTLAYDDMDLFTMGRLAVAALQVNLTSFFDAMPPEFHEAIQKYLKSAG